MAMAERWRCGVPIKLSHLGNMVTKSGHLLSPTPERSLCYFGAEFITRTYIAKKSISKEKRAWSWLSTRVI